MPSRRGKHFAVAVLALGVATLIGTGLASRDTILEEWYLHQLVSIDEKTWRPASDWLVEHGFLRTARRLLELCRKLMSMPGAELGGSPVNNSLIVAPDTLKKLALKMRREIVPVLLDALKDRSPQPGGVFPARRYGNNLPTPQQVYDRGEIGIGAATFLGELGPDGRDAIPALTEALKDPDARFRNAVAEALKRIQGE
ncbi:MAG TPA: HEAT repeat domain-containing protein [Nitrospirales bacterium]